MAIVLYEVCLTLIGKDGDFRDSVRKFAYSEREAVQKVLDSCKELGILVRRVDITYVIHDPCSQNPLYFGSAGHYH